MKKEEIMTLAQLLNGLNDSVKSLEGALNKKDMEGIAKAKGSILQFQKGIAKML
tara:strand:+ start:1541 stop:1702 length:162 start_codon:yes stop_codon:yes gene_type:complete